MEINNVTVEFKNGVKAVDHISLQIGTGIYGLLGENGAGKTTLMRVLSTIRKPTEGSITLNGISYEEKNYSKIQKSIGYLPQELNLYPDLTVRETLEYLGELSGMERRKCKEQIDYYLEKTNLTAHEKKKNKQLSGGMKRRVGLIQALLNDPQFVIVDEPTTGLDPEERIRIRNLLVEFSKNRTILFSTHVVEDLSATCSQLAVMKKGRFLYTGSMMEMIRLAKGHIWLCTVENEEEANKIEGKYLISSKQYTEEGILMKVVGNECVEGNHSSAQISLEDAYMYLMNQK